MVGYRERHLLMLVSEHIRSVFRKLTVGWVKRRAVNPEIAGSIPASLSKSISID